LDKVGELDDHIEGRAFGSEWMALAAAISLHLHLSDAAFPTLAPIAL
jgi:hypothetical protein